MLKKLSLILSIILIITSFVTSANDIGNSYPTSFVEHKFIGIPLQEKQPSSRKFLSSNQVGLYQYIYNQFYAGNTIIDVEDYNVTIPILESVYDRIVYENPELFVNTWCDVPMAYDEETGIVYGFGATYLDVGDITEARQLLSSMVNELVTYGSRFSSDFDKVLAIHDEIIKRYEYWKLRDGETEFHVNTSNAYSFAKYGEATCQAYSQLFNVVMKRLGINTTFCNNSNHQWSMVELNGKWYHIDLTWDDPIFNDGSNSYKAMHKYFLVSDSTMESDTWKPSHEPASTWGYTAKQIANDKYYEENTIFRKFCDVPMIFIPLSNGVYKGVLPINQNIYIESGIKVDKIMRSQPYEVDKETATFKIWLQEYNNETVKPIILAVYYDENGNIISSETATVKKENVIWFSTFIPCQVQLNKGFTDDSSKVKLYIWGKGDMSPYSISVSLDF